MFLKRFVTGVALVLAAAVVLIFSAVPYVVATVAAALGAMAVYELYRTAGLLRYRALRTLSVLIAIAFPYLEFPRFYYAEAGLFLFTSVLFLSLMRVYEKKRLDRLWFVFFIALLIPALLSALSYLSMLENGVYYLLVIVLASFGTDTVAYLAGSLFGRHKLAPHLSPKKSVEGFVCGVLASALLCWGFGGLLGAVYGLPVRYPEIALLGLLAGIVAQFGDLCMSLLKRNYGIKDYGTLLPGHGGVLDRFDSMLFVAPFVYVYVSFIGIL